VPARSPGGRPKTAPVYRVLVHHQYLHAWGPPSVGTSCVLKGKAGEPHKKGYSKTVHYEISGAGRINYLCSNTATDGERGDHHRVIKILTFDLDSH